MKKDANEDAQETAPGVDVRAGKKMGWSSKVRQVEAMVISMMRKALGLDHAEDSREAPE